MSQWVMAEFSSGKALIQAAKALRADGFRRIDLYSPYPLKGADEALGLSPSRITWVGLLFGLSGAVGAYLIQWFTNAVDYPLNAGNRPLNSLPAFVPIMFESAVLAASVGIFFGLLALFGFPRLHHPVFELEPFRSASVDGYWVSITFERADDEMDRAMRRLEGLGARQVSRVAPEDTGVPG